MKLSNRRWRLENLYSIKSKAGEKIPFRLNWAQDLLLQGLWYFSIVLKVRQVGITTFFCVLYLDDVLFSRNRTAAIIAHKLEDAKKIFRDKVKYAWDNLPEWLKDCYDVNTDSSSELVFSLKGSDGKEPSSISVSTSVRSGTVQRLHITELGYTDRHHPEKAQEIKTGALNAVQAGQMVSIESTADGREGLFYELYTRASDDEKLGRQLTKLSFKPFFFPWWKHPEYVLDTPVTIPKELQDYFAELEVKVGVHLTEGQKWWYVKKRETEDEDMFREYPSTPEEAFMASIEGAYYATQMNRVFLEHRVTKVPWTPTVPVETWWDLGMDDYTVILFVQRIGKELRFIDAEYGSGEGLAHYANVLAKRPYQYVRHVMPHDIAVRELGTGKARIDVARGLGIRPIVVSTDPNGRAWPIEDGIEAVRSILSRCWFDEEKCARLVADLQNYRKQFDEKLGVFRASPLHDDTSHGADAFRTGAMAYRDQPGFAGGSDTRAEILPDNNQDFDRREPIVTI